MEQTTDNFVIGDLRLEDRLIKFIQNCCADELGRIAGQCFGGDCLADGDQYRFYPNENYTGEFGPYKTPEPWREEKVRTAREIRNALAEAFKHSDGMPVRLIALEGNSNGASSIRDIIQYETLENTHIEAVRYSETLTCVEIVNQD